MREKEYRNLLHFHMLQAAEVFLPFRVLKKYDHELRLLSDIGYISLTFTFLDKLTLGEEYAEIKPKFSPPSWLARFTKPSADGVPFVIRLLYTLISSLSSYYLRKY